MSGPPLLYSRDLPGGGFVAIDVRPDVDAEGRAPRPHRARLWVERRADASRRAGHAPPVIAQVEDADAAGAVDALRAIAADNVALAQAIRRWADEAGRPPRPT